jgi:exosortase C (VPDSG-CTERM-specific)
VKTTATLPFRRGPAGLVPALAVLAAAFAQPLWRLARFAAASELYSYILVIPLISLGLVWLQREPRPGPSPANRRLAAVLLLAGAAAAIAGRAAASAPGAEGSPPDSLLLMAGSFVLALAGILCWFLGRETIRATAFSLGFLALIVPLPLPLSAALETFLQHASAGAAAVFFQISGMPFFQGSDLDFQLPGMNLQVAPQCSGLHSTLALVILSVPLGYLFLRSPWRRAALAAAAIAIGIVRNGFRIFVIGELCVRVGPQMIDSYIHRTGGWIFFLIFLGPFLLLLLLLARSETAAGSRRDLPEGAKCQN